MGDEGKQEKLGVGVKGTGKKMRKGVENTRVGMGLQRVRDEAYRFQRVTRTVSPMETRMRGSSVHGAQKKTRGPQSSGQMVPE